MSLLPALARAAKLLYVVPYPGCVLSASIACTFLPLSPRYSAVTVRVGFYTHRQGAPRKEVYVHSPFSGGDPSDGVSTNRRLVHYRPYRVRKETKDTTLLFPLPRPTTVCAPHYLRSNHCPYLTNLSQHTRRVVLLSYSQPAVLCRVTPCHVIPTMPNS